MCRDYNLHFKFKDGLVMIELIDRERCTGCMACTQACPMNAISGCEDELGDCYPSIHYDQCVSCGKCRKACPVCTPPAMAFPKAAYAVWSLDAISRKKSASGGAAAEFYLSALENGYYICGAEYDGAYIVRHTVNNAIDSVDGYRQSKYVYSDFVDAYKQIEDLLVQGEYVLCISLPCKIAGLLSFLGRPYERLVTVDIVCHGTPPVKQLKEHIQSKAKDASDMQLHFREDNLFLFNLSSRGKTVYRKIGRTDTYLAAFLEGLNYRTACYQCTYAKPERVSDITICDFWGLGAETPFEHPYTGAVSAALINTAKGDAFFTKSRDRLFVEKRSVNEAVKGNAQLNSPTPVHKKREEFVNAYIQNGFEKAVSMCLSAGMKMEKKRLFKMTLRNSLRNIAGVFIKRYR